MKTKSRPQYYRVRRVLEMVREGTQSGYLANSSDFKEELGVSRRTVARDLDFLRDEEHAPIEYDESKRGYLLTDDSYSTRSASWISATRHIRKPLMLPDGLGR